MPNFVTQLQNENSGIKSGRETQIFPVLQKEGHFRGQTLPFRKLSWAQLFMAFFIKVLISYRNKTSWHVYNYWNFNLWRYERRWFFSVPMCYEKYRICLFVCYWGLNLGFVTQSQDENYCTKTEGPQILPVFEQGHFRS